MSVAVDALRGWGEPIATSSASGATVDFTNLGGYKELLFWGDGLLFGGASDAPGMRFSSDNGSTYISSGYENGDSTTGNFSIGSNATTAHGFLIEVLDFNVARKPKVRADAARIGVAVANRWGTRAAGPYNAVRFLGAGNNFSAGTITVYGRN